MGVIPGWVKPWHLLVVLAITSSALDTLNELDTLNNHRLKGGGFGYD